MMYKGIELSHQDTNILIEINEALQADPNQPDVLKDLQTFVLIVCDRWMKKNDPQSYSESHDSFGRSYHQAQSVEYRKLINRYNR